MIKTDSWTGRVALMVAQCAGMVDLVALPLWVGQLMAHYRFDPQQAGGLATLFLVGAVLASLWVAPRMDRLPRRWLAVAGFGLGALAFFLAAGQSQFGVMAALHLLGGLANGAALSVAHGTIARSDQPHRLYAVVSTALGVFAVAFYATVPTLLTTQGGVVLFRVFAGIMALASLTALLAFPQDDAPPTAAAAAPAASFTRAVWFGMVGMGCMGLVQAMTFAFLERAGHARGFEPGAIGAVLFALGLVNLLPAPLAALLERRLDARSVLLAGPVVQALLVSVIMLSPTFAPFAAAASVFAAVIIFAHPFKFGLLARLEPSGRALAATPAMVMAGAAIGPILGGTLVKTLGYGSLVGAAAVIALVAVLCFRQLPARPAPLARNVLA